MLQEKLSMPSWFAFVWGGRWTISLKRSGNRRLFGEFRRITSMSHPRSGGNYCHMSCLTTVQKTIRLVAFPRTPSLNSTP